MSDENNKVVLVGFFSSRQILVLITDGNYPSWPGVEIPNYVRGAIPVLSDKKKLLV